MKRFSIAVLVVSLLLTFPGSVSAQVGADCTDPPNLVPFADLTNCDLSDRNMEGADLAHANLTGANLDNASLFTTNLVETIFDHANLRGANMEDAYSPGGSFINADLRGTNLYFSTFRDANISSANFSANWITSADFAGATAQNTVFAGADIRFTNFTGADLRGADLSNTTLVYVTLVNADLRNATLLGADRQTGTHLDGAIWGNTTCADGSNSDDADGDNFTCDSNFPANQPPVVVMTSPANNSTAIKGSPVTLSADATDSDGTVIRVEFHANGTPIYYDPAAPYSFDWVPTAAGAYVITARAFDDHNHITTSQPVTVNVVPDPNNQPPSVTITSPKNNATVYRFLGTTIKANASDPNGVITKVEFYAGSTLLGADTSAPYSFVWKPVSKGSFTLTAKAYDDDGAVATSNAVTVRVK